MLCEREAFPSLRMTIRNSTNVAADWPRFLFWGKRGEARMKNRKNLGCLIKGSKERGAWAELYFMVLAMSQGLRVSSPYGGFGPYDVGVEGATGPILRVQVKCTVFRVGKGYSINCFGPKQGPKRSGYAEGT